MLLTCNSRWIKLALALHAPNVMALLPSDIDNGLGMIISLGLGHSFLIVFQQSL